MIRWLVLSVVIASSAPAQAPSATDERVKALEAENRRLQDEVQALKLRLQQLETGKPPTSSPTATDEPGAEPWGNPTAIRRTMADSMRTALDARGVRIPDAQSDARAWALYQSEFEHWLEVGRLRGQFTKAVSWHISVQETIVVSNMAPHEIEVRAFALNESGQRVGREFDFRCPASALPDRTDPRTVRGDWTLSGEVTVDVRWANTQPTGSAAPFRPTDRIAPRVECDLRYAVKSLEPRSADSATPGGAPRPAR